MQILCTGKVKYLHETVKAECPYVDTISNAASKGYLAIVKYLHETVKAECPYVDTISEAARNGYLEIVKYLNGMCLKERAI